MSDVILGNIPTTEGLLHYIAQYIDTGNCHTDGGKWEGMGFAADDDVWDYYAILTGKPVHLGDRGSVFSCSCG